MSDIDDIRALIEDFPALTVHQQGRLARAEAALRRLEKVAGHAHFFALSKHTEAIAYGYAKIGQDTKNRSMDPSMIGMDTAHAIADAIAAMKPEGEE